MSDAKTRWSYQIRGSEEPDSLLVKKRVLVSMKIGNGENWWQGQGKMARGTFQNSFCTDVNKNGGLCSVSYKLSGQNYLKDDLTVKP